MKFKQHMVAGLVALSCLPSWSADAPPSVASAPAPAMVPSAPISAATPAINMDLVVLVKASKALGGDPVFGKNIDNTLRVAKKGVPATFNNCMLQDQNKVQQLNPEFLQALSAQLIEAKLPQLLNPFSIYRKSGIFDIDAMVTERLLAKLTEHGLKVEILKNCGPGGAAAVPTAAVDDLVVVPKTLLPFLLKVPGSEGIAKFEPLLNLSFDELKQAADVAMKRRVEEQKAKVAMLEEYKKLAETDDRSKVGALILSFERGTAESPKAQPFCTVASEGLDSSAIYGYRALEEKMFSSATQAFLAKENVSVKLKGDEFFNKTFKTINDVYLNVAEKKGEGCNILIDFPKNLVTLANAMERDGRKMQNNFALLITADEGRETYAKRRGYKSHAHRQMAIDLKTNLDGLKSLEKFGVDSVPKFKAAVAEMRQMKYGESEEVSAVLVFLQDKEEGKAKKRSAVAQRDARAAQEKQAQEQAEAERRKQREEAARNYPYEAVLSCGFQGNHINIVACFSGGSSSVNTELEVRNGQNYAMYKPWEVSRAGNEIGGVGLTFKLRPNFEIKAQNSSENLTLTLIIKDVLTGRVVYTKSAAHFGVIRASN